MGIYCDGSNFGDEFPKFQVTAMRIKKLLFIKDTNINGLADLL